MAFVCQNPDPDSSDVFSSSVSSDSRDMAVGFVIVDAPWARVEEDRNTCRPRFAVTLPEPIARISFPAPQALAVVTK
jgi:hypothetical protein